MGPYIQDLVEYLAQRLGCMISDLQSLQRRDALRRELEQVPAERCTPGAWRECLAYLTDVRLPETLEPGEVRRRLLSSLNGPAPPAARCPGKVFISVCDPSPPDLAKTAAVVCKTLRALHLDRYADVFPYGDPTALLAGPACDLCITETDLGTLSGFALIEEVRRRRPAAEAVFVTADGSNDTALKAWGAKVSAYLIKPLESAEDRAQLRTILELCVARFLSRPPGNQDHLEPHGALIMRHMPHDLQK